jgi:phosphoglycolate phosphatase
LRTNSHFPRQPISRLGSRGRAGVPVIGVEFGCTEVPIAELEPDRLIGHMRGLPAALQT